MAWSSHSGVDLTFATRLAAKFRKETPIMTTVNTAFPGEQPSMNRVSRFFRKIDAFIGNRRRVSGLSRRIAAFMLRASLGMLALAAVFALQAAFYVYVWRLPG
jgi:hypothetical protein